jgi:hypothetical protein
MHVISGDSVRVWVVTVVVVITIYQYKMNNCRESSHNHLQLTQLIVTLSFTSTSVSQLLSCYSLVTKVELTRYILIEGNFPKEREM